MSQASKSLWKATAAASSFDPLRGDVLVDVAIVGAGITGLTAAVLLQERGLKVAVLEKESVAGGETGNTTAHLTEAIDARYHYINRKYSQDEARLVAGASHAALEKIAELVEQHSIDCRFRRVPGYLYTEKRSYVAELKNEAVAARGAGLDAQWTTEVPLPFAIRGAVLFANQAQFHPLEYLAGLARVFTQSGGRIFERTFVKNVEQGEPCVVETESGRVQAKHVLMATNVPISGFTHVHTLAAPYRTYAIAFEASDTHPDGLFWDTADPYHYTRWQDTDAGTFMIVGGEDHRVGEEDTDASFSRLLDYTREHFGDQRERYRWSGQINEPHGGLPLIGSSGSLYVSTGYSGQGMTFGTLGAMMFADFVTGTENRFKDLFDHTRARPHMTAREFLTENLQFPKHLVADRVLSRDVEGKETADIPSGDARIVSVDGKKIAAYRDESGTLHRVSPVCTHMGCDVAWNPAEKSWDCPCHGSRFTPDGSVLNGPANAPLGKIE